MRSELVFRAHDQIENRYELCKTAAKMTRRFHTWSMTTHDAINDAFVHLGGSPANWPAFNEALVTPVEQLPASPLLGSLLFGDFV